MPGTGPDGTLQVKRLKRKVFNDPLILPIAVVVVVVWAISWAAIEVFY